MKKTIGIMAVASLLLSACDTLQKTATTANISTQIHSAATVADLKVGDRISYTMTPSKDVLRGGEANVRHVAEAEALTKKGGNADILLEPNYTITKKRGFFTNKITSITVSGRPAFYTNFRSLPDSVLCNPVFRGIKTAKKLSPAQRPTTKALSAVTYDSKARKLRHRGLSMQFELNLGASFLDNDHHHDAYPMVAFLLNPAYNINSRWAVGLGIGYDYQGDADIWSVPLYVHARHYFSPSVKSWFVDGRLGSNIACYENISSGAYVRVGIGYSFKYFEIAARYNYTGSYYAGGHNEYEWEDWDDFGYGNDKSRYVHQALLSLAWKF